MLVDFICEVRNLPVLILNIKRVIYFDKQFRNLVGTTRSKTFQLTSMWQCDIVFGTVTGLESSFCLKEVEIFNQNCLDPSQPPFDPSHPVTLCFSALPDSDCDCRSENWLPNTSVATTHLPFRTHGCHSSRQPSARCSESRCALHRAGSINSTRSASPSSRLECRQRTDSEIIYSVLQSSSDEKEEGGVHWGRWLWSRSIVGEKNDKNLRQETKD